MWQPTPMRRGDRALDKKEACRLLDIGEYGILATASAEGDPEATPLSYVVMDGALYFHCAQTGHKLGNIAARPRVCFTVVGRTRPVFEANGNFSTLFESTMVHGVAALVEDELEKQRALMALCEKYMPDKLAFAPDAINRSIGVTAVVRISPEEITGKAKRTVRP